MPWGRASDGHRGKAAVIRTEIISLARAKKNQNNTLNTNRCQKNKPGALHQTNRRAENCMALTPWKLFKSPLMLNDVPPIHTVSAEPRPAAATRVGCCCPTALRAHGSKEERGKGIRTYIQTTQYGVVVLLETRFYMGFVLLHCSARALE